MLSDTFFASQIHPFQSKDRDPLDDQDKSTGPQDDFKSNPATRNILPPRESPITINQQDGSRESDSNVREVARGLHFLEKLNIVGQLSLVFIGIVAASIYGCQLHTMNGQLEEMRNSTFAARQAAYAACVGAQVSNAELKEAMIAGIDAHNSAVASAYQTMIATQSEAAHMTFNFKPFEVAEGSPITFEVEEKNDGKSAASNVVLKIRSMLIDRGQDPKFTYPLKQIARVETAHLLAGEEPGSLKLASSISMKNADGSVYYLTRSDNDSLQAGKKDFMLFARLTYIDTLGVNHWVNYCRVTQSPNSGGAHKGCIRYNKEDSNTVFPKPKTEPSMIAAISDITCEQPPKE